MLHIDSFENCLNHVLANTRAGKKWSLEDDEEEEEEDAKLKAEALLKLEPMEAIEEEMQETMQVEPAKDEEDDVDPLDAFMKVIVLNPILVPQLRFTFYFHQFIIGNSKRSTQSSKAGHA